MSAQATASYPSSIEAGQMNISPVAAEQFTRLMGEIDDDEIEAIRIYVAGGGCAGMTYGMTFTDRRSEYDQVLEGDGFNIYVDAVAMNYIKGVEIDYVSRDTGASFVFNNVFQATGGSGVCGGCGAIGGGGGGGCG